MIILQKTNNPQNVKFVPTRVAQFDDDLKSLNDRLLNENGIIEAEQCLKENIGYLPNILKITNETTNEVVTQNITCSVERFYFTFSAIFDLEEGHFYSIEIFANQNLIHRDKIFCTNQNVDTYSVNKDQYIPKGNDIIFYE